MTLTDIFFWIGLYFAAMISILVFMKARSRGKINVLVLKPSMQYEVKASKTDTNKIKMNKSWLPTFQPSNIFEEIKASWKFWRNPKRLVLIPEKAAKAVGWKRESAKNFPELSQMWSSEELRKFIRKEVLKARMEIKPMSNMMFIVFAVLIAFNLFLTFMIGNRIGVF